MDRAERKRAAAIEQRQAAVAELEEIAEQLRDARKLVATMPLALGPDGEVTPYPERRAARQEVRRLQEQYRDAQRRLVAVEMDEVAARFRDARRTVADLRPERRPGEKVPRSPERRAARQELRRLHQLRRETRQRLVSQRAESRSRRAERVHRRWERVQASAAAEGVADYFPYPDDVDAAWLPGYARKPEYLKSRRAFVLQCRELGDLRTADRVLDVGCGIGGVAVFLVGELGDQGAYVGLDVDERAIDWCRQHIGVRHENFTFEVMDVFSSKYNPQGSHKPLDYRFPFDDGSFDFVIMRSLFTHMLPPDVDHYLGEVARLLAPGGRSAITFFLLDAATEAAFAAGTATRQYPYRFDGYRLDNEDVVEAAVAIDETWVREAYCRYGLEITSVVEGTWRGDEVGPNQDTVYATRR